MDLNNIYELTEEDIKNFYITFCKSILEENSGKELTDIKQILYKNVLTYFANGKTDEAIKLLDIVLNYTYTGENVNLSSSFCGCNSYLNNNSSNISCLDIYKNSMLEHLKVMFGDKDFYYEWLYKVKGASFNNAFGKAFAIKLSKIISKFPMFRTTPDRVPNNYLIDKLIFIIDSFLEMNLDMSFNTNRGFYCSYSNDDLEKHNENVKILKNYRSILEIIKVECGIQNNINKIKYYGGKFAELLPKLQYI